MLSDIRLPQDRGTPDALPQPDEIVQFGYSGFLELGAALNWGYALSGAEGFGLRDLQASADYALKAKAALSIDYRLAGDFAMTVRRGGEPGFVRLVVQKHRESRRQYAAGFDVEAGYRIDGLPETPEEFLATFLGTDLSAALTAFEQGLESPESGGFERQIGKLFAGVLEDLARRWAGGGFGPADVDRVQAELRKAVAAYRGIDDRIVGAAMDLYDKALGPRRDAMIRALTAIQQLQAGGDVVALGDPDVWNLLQELTGGDVFALVFGEGGQALARVRDTAAAALAILIAPDFERLRDLIDTVKAGLNLDQLFARLEQISTPGGLAELADTTLQGLVERVLGRPFESLGRDPGDAFRDLRATLGKLGAFKQRFCEKMRQALEQSVSLRINSVYTHATADQALLDLEIDVRTPSGQQLFRQAVSGRLREAFLRARGGDVRVHQAALSHELTQSSQLQISVLGWREKRLVEVVCGSEHSLQAHDGGLVQVFTTTASIKEVVERGTETLQSNFVLRLAGESAGALQDDGTRRFIARTLSRMSVDYEILQSDEMTEPADLAGYLALGEDLGLTPPGVLDDLGREFAAGFGRVSARYVVRYDDEAVRNAFALPAEQVVALARATARRLVSSCFVQGKHRAFLAAVGLAYADPGIAAIYYDHGGLLQLARTEIAVTLPASVTGGSAAADRIGPATRDKRNDVLGRLFANEDILSGRLAALDGAIARARLQGQAVTIGELEDASRAVVGAAADMNQLGGPNAFFAVIDALVAAGAGRRTRRESALVLEVTPPGGQKVTKMFMQAA